jgi:hypothetical protein
MKNWAVAFIAAVIVLCFILFCSYMIFWAMP